MNRNCYDWISQPSVGLFSKILKIALSKSFNGIPLHQTIYSPLLWPMSLVLAPFKCCNLCQIIPYSTLQGVSDPCIHHLMFRFHPLTPTSVLHVFLEIQRFDNGTITNRRRSGNPTIPQVAIAEEFNKRCSAGKEEMQKTQDATKINQRC